MISYAKEKDKTRTARRGTWIAVGVALVWLVISSFAGPLAGQLSTVQENDSAAFLPSSAESTEVAQSAVAFAGEESLPVLVVASDPDGGPVSADQSGSFTVFAQTLPEVELPSTLDSQVVTVGEFLTPAPLVTIPSETGNALLLNVALEPGLVDTQLDDGSEVFISVVDTIRVHAETFPGVQINVTGPGGFLADLIKVFGAIDTTLLIASALVVAIILIFVYRSPFLWLIPLIAAGISLSAASAVVYLLASSGALTLTGQSQGILTVLVFGAGTDYSLLLISRYREELTRAANHILAIRKAVRATFAPIVASAATTSIGLTVLLLSELNSNKSTGPVAAAGIVVACVVMLTFLPALLAIPSVVLPVLAFLLPTVTGFAISFFVDVPLTPFLATGGALAALTVFAWIGFGIARVRGVGPFTRDRFTSGAWAFWPRVPSPADEFKPGVWAKVAGVVGRRPKFTWAATAVALAILAGFSTSLSTAGVSSSFTNPQEVDSVVGEEILGDNFAAGLGGETLILAPADSSDELLTAVLDTPGVDSAAFTNEPPDLSGLAELDLSNLPESVTSALGPEVLSALDSVESAEDLLFLPDAVLAAIPQLVPGFDAADLDLSPKVVNDQVLLSVTLSDPVYSSAAEETVIALRENVAGLGASVGGPTAVNYDVEQANLRDRNLIIPVVLLVIAVILVILLRSLVAPALLVGTVLLSFFATLGACYLAFEYILNIPGTDASFPLFAFVFLVALGVDYNIFLMTRVREEARSMPAKAAVLKGLTVTGGVITSAGIVLAATFLVLGVLPLVALRQIGFAVALGVLIDAFIVRTTLVPALAYSMGRFTWWPSKLSSRSFSDSVQGAYEDSLELEQTPALKTKRWLTEPGDHHRV